MTSPNTGNGVKAAPPYAKPANYLKPSAVRTALAHPDWHVFPIMAGTKKQGMPKDNLDTGATNNPKVIGSWNPQSNAGVASAKSGLVVVDVDCKEGKPGEQTFNDLELKHGTMDAPAFPKTYTVRTPSGGRHLYYRATDKVRHRLALGKSGFGPGIDSANYVVLAGSRLSGEDGNGAYTVTDNSPIADAPDWFAEYLKPREHAAVDQTPVVDLDQPHNIERAIAIINEWPPSIAKAGGEKAMFDLAARLKDEGISYDMAVTLIDEHYNKFGRCDPLWDRGSRSAQGTLDWKVGNAYEYLKENAPGGATGEAEFSGDPLDPVELDAQIARSNEFYRKMEEDKAYKALTTVAGVDDPDPSDIDAAKRAALAVKNRPAGQQSMPLLTRAQVMEDWVYIASLKLFVERNNPENALGVEAFDLAFMYLRGKATKFHKVLLDAPTGTIRRLSRIAYLPNEDEFTKGAEWNQWRPGPIKPKRGDTTQFHRHIDYLFPPKVDDQGEHLQNWMAGVLQRPEVKPRHQMLLQGRIQGTGKTLFPRLMRELLGHNNCQGLSQDIIESTFTGWAIRCKFAWVEEVREAKGIRKTTNKLHAWASEKTITINQKNWPTFSMDQVIAMMLMSNSDDPLQLDMTDRRYLNLRTHAKAHPDGGAYYDALYGRGSVGGMLNDPDALAAIYYELLHRDLGSYSIEHEAPFTDAKADTLRATMTPEARWMVEHAEAAPLRYDVVDPDRIVAELPTHLRGRFADEAVRNALRDHFGGFPWSKQLRLTAGSRDKSRVWLLRERAKQAGVLLQAGKTVPVLHWYREERAGEPAEGAADFAE